MPTATRTYWLTSPSRIRRKDQSLVIERATAPNVHIPITDVRDIVACAEVDINTSVVSLLNRHRVSIHLLSYYGDYAGSLLTSDTSTSGSTVLAQARLAQDGETALTIARDIVQAAAFNVRRVLDRKLLARPHTVLQNAVADARQSRAHGCRGHFPQIGVGRPGQQAALVAPARRSQPPPAQKRQQRLHQLRERHHPRPDTHRRTPDSEDWRWHRPEV
ncbi:hypothetical protein GCM10012280_54430 [Wenjunlia tyrosinilytica]|uniref:Uncharacterized protein n=1 Tax=Wenjunlia tyrosinilytica TaxID=1544741 RepID=A0A917ZVK4_9ACTN|nr:CRISPR-associated endonuclease Cas1 [Wenjunlia tyrosinilytica]GGO95979.1 hypothetical protein GCM10012280_54430 [Wenjunlia tyrosinilytica]